jgi:hypothetical protein
MSQADSPNTTSPSRCARPAATFSTVERLNFQSAGAVRKNPRFDKTYCSQCGAEFGPGNSGYSHCQDHPKPAQQIPESVATAHADFLTRIATLRPNRIVYNADWSDLEERAEHLQAILNATALYCAEVVADTVYCSEPGLIDGKYLVGLISDLAGDVVGGLLNASEEMQGVAR